MPILAQIEPIQGADLALKTAASHSWEAVILVVILVGCLTLFGVLMRWFIASMDNRLNEANKREERLAARIADLEKIVETTLMRLLGETSAALTNNSQVVGNLIAALNGRPCFWDAAKQEQMIEHFAEKMKG